MRRLNLFIFCIIFSIPHLSQALQVSWFDRTFQEATVKARNEQKELLLYFTATWCGPCRQMDKSTFSDAEITGYLDRNFVAYKADIDDSVGRSLYFQYTRDESITVPYFTVVDAQVNEVVKAKTGMMNSEDFFNFLSEPTSLKERYSPKSAEEIQPLTAQFSSDSSSNSFLFKLYFSDVKLGFRLGYNRSSFSTSSSQNHALNQSIGGVSAELFADYTTYGKFLFQGGIALTPKGAYNPESGQLQRLRYLEIPLRISYTIFNHPIAGCPQPVRITFIPYGAYAISAQSSEDNRVTSLPLGNGPGELNRFDYGVKAGISLDLGSFEPSFGYDFGLGNISNNPGEQLFNRGFYFNMALIWGK